MNCEGAGRPLSIPALPLLSSGRAGVRLNSGPLAIIIRLMVKVRADGRFATETNRRASPKKQKAPSLPLEDLLNSIGALSPI